jgi:hypothetical protein
MTELPVAMGVVRRLRRALGDEAGTYVGYMSDLRPPPGMGQWYISVGQNTSVGTCHDAAVVDAHTVTVCVTCKYAYVPRDRVGESQLNSAFYPNPQPGFASGGLPPLAERPEVQPPLEWLCGFARSVLLGDYELIKDVNYFLGFDKTGESHGTSDVSDPRYGVASPFKQAATGMTQTQGGGWVDGYDGRDAGLYVKMCTLSGLQTITPQRYRLGDDRTWESL